MLHKKLLFQIPEILLMVAVMIYWLSAGQPINYIAISLITLLIYLSITKNRFLGITIPSVLIVICLYFILALLSEVFEFPEFNGEAQQLLFTGLIIFLGTMIISIVMIYKYATLKKQT